jgi:uncharacterized membrane protein YeiH
MLHYLYLIAIVAEAMSGAIMGMRRKMDLFGISVIGTITALGGGTIRDVLLGHHPLGWIAHPEYLLFTVGATIVTTFVAQHLHHLRKVFLFVDALGLVTFTVIGCDVARQMGVSDSIAILSGMMTGVFGGLLRDVLCNQVPLVLRRDLYASVSLLAGTLYLGLLAWNVSPLIATTAAIVMGMLLRILSLRFGWHLPCASTTNVRGFD